MKYKVMRAQTYLLGLLLISLIFSSYVSSLKLNTKLRSFESEKVKIEEKINSMRLGNYLRKLMMKNNNLIDNEFYFLGHPDFNVNKKDLFYSTLEEKDSDDEFRARLFAHKWIVSEVKKGSSQKTQSQQSDLKPFTISKGNEDLESSWKNFLVLLIGKKTENKVLKICFPADLRDNFAIITGLNGKCSTKIEKINEYQILDSNDNNIQK